MQIQTRMPPTRTPCLVSEESSVEKSVELGDSDRAVQPPTQDLAGKLFNRQLGLANLFVSPATTLASNADDTMPPTPPDLDWAPLGPGVPSAFDAFSETSLLFAGQSPSSHQTEGGEGNSGFRVKRARERFYDWWDQPP
jgi:hypothetical protein